MSTTRPIATTRSATGIPTGKLAVWWVIGSEIVIFGGLLASYIMHRLGHPEWAEYALTSSLFAVLAHYAAEHGDGKKAAKWLLGTCAGGLVFLGVKAVEWTGEIQHGYTITANGFLHDHGQRLLALLLHRGGTPRAPRHCRLYHHADHRERCAEGQRASSG
jgi:heme/copper-type cytochrome/quinol oxidase subunit 3